MQSYVILSRFSPGAFDDPRDILGLADKVTKKIKKECPDVQWKDSYAVMGSCDVVDILEAETPEAARKAALIIHGYGHATTEVMCATPWSEFLGMLKA
jgi:uncharacterized protein with GYD domain